MYAEDVVIVAERGEEWQGALEEWNMSKKMARSSSFVVSFAQFSPTCGRMPLPALSLWPGRQPYMPRLVDGMRGGGPSSDAPRSRNPPTGRRRDIPISSSRFSHGPPQCAVGLDLANRARIIIIFDPHKKCIQSNNGN